VWTGKTVRREYELSVLPQFSIICIIFLRKNRENVFVYIQWKFINFKIKCLYVSVSDLLIQPEFLGLYETQIN